MTAQKKYSRRIIIKYSMYIFIIGFSSIAYIKRKIITLFLDKIKYRKNLYRLNRASEVGSLEPQHVNNILGLATVIIPWKDGKQMVEDITKEYILSKSKYENGYRELYETTSKILDRKTKNKYGTNVFYEIEYEKKKFIIDEIIPSVSTARKNVQAVNNLFFNYENSKITELVIHDILNNFFRDDQSTVYLRN